MEHRAGLATLLDLVAESTKSVIESTLLFPGGLAFTLPIPSIPSKLTCCMEGFLPVLLEAGADENENDIVPLP
jgi:hypothetical protein